MKAIYTLFFLVTLNLLYTDTQAQWVQQGPGLGGSSNYGSFYQGYCTAFSADGLTMVSSYSADTNTATTSGGVFVFRLSGGVWVQQTRISMGWAPGTGNGGNLALSANGNTLAVSGLNGDSILVYTYNGSWTAEAALVPAIAAQEDATQQLALSYDGNTLLYHTQIYVRNGRNYTLQATLEPSDRAIVPASCDSTVNHFSCWATSSLSADGNTAVIGDVYAPDSSTNAWVFVRNGTTWSQQGSRLEGTGNSGGQLMTLQISGSASVVVSGNGNRIAIGMQSNVYADTVWVFDRVNGVWLEEDNRLVDFNLTASSNVLSISYNGNAIAKTATGQFYFSWFSYNGTTWSSDEHLYQPASPIYTQDGISLGGVVNNHVHIDSAGAHIILGNCLYETNNGGVAYYQVSGDTLSQVGGNIFGTGISGYSGQNMYLALSADGSTMAKGSLEDNGNEGAVWVFNNNGGSWSQIGSKIVVPDSVWEDRLFGESVALSSDGSTMVVGAPNSNFIRYNYTNDSTYGSVYTYQRSGQTYTQVGNILSNTYSIDFGYAVALSGDGKTMLVAASDSGVFAYTWVSNAWVMQAYLSAGSGSNWGAVKLSGDGNTAVIANTSYNNNKGEIYIYYRSGSTWTAQAPGIHPASIYQGDNFPSSLAITPDGNTIAAGCMQCSNGGNVYIYRRTGSTWGAADSVLNGSNGGSPESGQAVVISVTGDTVAEMSYFAAYNYGIKVYTGTGSNWTEMPSIINTANLRPLNEEQMTASSDMKYIAAGYLVNSLSNADALVFRLMPMVDSLVLNQPATCPQAANGSITVTAYGGPGPYNYTWSNGALTATASNLLPGIYTVTINDAGGDTVVRQYTVNSTYSLQGGYNTYWNCNANSGAIAISATGGSTPYTYSWTPTLTNVDSSSALSAGNYTFTVTDAAGCTYNDSAVLTASVYWVNATSTDDESCSQSGTATATMYGGVSPYSYVWSSGQTTGAITGLGAGNYTATVTDANGCSVSTQANVNSYCNDLISGRVFFDRNNNCIQDAGELGVPNLTMIADNGSNTVYGSTDSSGNYVIVTPGVGNYSVSIAHFQECSYPVCTGSSYPALVTLAGNPDTAANVNFALVNAGIDLALQAYGNCPFPGSAFSYTTYYGNLQDSVLPTGMLTVSYDSRLTFVSSVPAYTTLDTVAHVATFNLTQIGSLYPLSVQQAVTLNFNLSDTVLPRGILLMQSSITPVAGDCNIDNNTILVPIYVAGSIDPNYKIAYPENNLALTDSVLTYTIHFQNVGNGPTHFIKVLDTLQSNLNPASVVTIATSHLPYTFNITKAGILSWEFNPITLPDSASDPAGSQGYITFKVTTKAGLSLGTDIKNTGFVYFDYNTAVVTNTTNNIIGNPNGITVVKNNDFNMVLYPNPAGNLVNVETDIQAVGGTLELSDVTGRQVDILTITNTVQQVNTGAMADGVYFVKVITLNGKSAVGKLVIGK